MMYLSFDYTQYFFIFDSIIPADLLPPSLALHMSILQTTNVCVKIIVRMKMIGEYRSTNKKSCDISTFVPQITCGVPVDELQAPR